MTVTTIVEIEDDEELTEEAICDRAYGQFGGIENLAGFGDCDYMIGVPGDEGTIEASGDVEFTECEEDE